MIPTVEDLPEIVTADPPMLEEESAEEDKPRSSRKFDLYRFNKTVMIFKNNLLYFRLPYEKKNCFYNY